MNTDFKKSDSGSDGLSLSIIIPVYNKERYVEQCIRSCVDQDLQRDSYEIIIVNDGSTDGSADIIRGFSDPGGKIRYIEQPNQGPGAARNRGLKEARGEYIWFVDSDDRIASNCLKQIVEILKQEQLDALQIGYQIAFENGGQASANHGVNTGVCGPREYIVPRVFIGATCITIFRREIATSKGIEFNTDIVLAEDQLYFSEVLDNCTRIKGVDRVYYHYLVNSSSVTQRSSTVPIENSILKIRQFKLFDRYSAYFRYVLSFQFFEYLKAGGSVVRLNRIIPPALMKDVYKWHNGYFRKLMFYYQYIGLIALIVFLCFKKTRLWFSKEPGLINNKPLITF